MPSKPRQVVTWTFEWKSFFIYGAIWIGIIFASLFLYNAGQHYVEQQRFIQNLIQYYSEDQNGDKENVSPFDRRGSGLTLEKWISKNLPRNAEKERDEVADIFADVAQKVGDGEFKGTADAFPEIIARSQPVIDRKVWLPFLAGLSTQIKKEKVNSSTELADVLRRIANTIRTSRRHVAAVELLTPANVEEGGEANKEISPPPSPEEKDVEENTPTQTGYCPGGVCFPRFQGGLW